MLYCKICDMWECDKHVFSIGKTKNILSFSGSSPPEIFIGRWNYPNVYTGILSPEEHGDTAALSSPEIWHEKKLSIKEILNNRNKLIYGRQQSSINNLRSEFSRTMQEIAMTHRPISASFFLKKPIQAHEERDAKVPLISNAAQVEKVKLDENTQIKPKVDYIVNDKDAKSVSSIVELDKAGINTSSIIKILSAGLLGLKKNRKLVPTRWSITATDDTLGKEKLKKIRYLPEISSISLFNAEYLGNHYEFLLLPDKWSFEVIEISLKNNGIWQDYEKFEGRKNYADDVTGAYYVNRLAVCEYLERIKRQASILVLRQISHEYTSPLGVGILRETSRAAFAKKPETFSSLKEAFAKIQERIKLPIEQYTKLSLLLKDFGKQSRLGMFFSK